MIVSPDSEDFDALRWRFSAMEFWATPSEWPVDTNRHIFLARAFRILGAAVEPDLWDDQDTFLQYAPLFVEGNPQALDGPEQVYALRLLQEYRLDLAIDPERVARLADEPLTEAERTAAFAAFDEHVKDARLRSLNRVNALILWMIRLLAGGFLKASTREMIGDGRFRPLAPKDWNRDGVECRFAFCLASRTVPPDDSDGLAPPSFWKAAPSAFIPKSSWPQYIYISKKHLASVLDSLARKAVSPKVGPPATVPINVALQSSVRAMFAKKKNRKFDWASFGRKVGQELEYHGDIDPKSDTLWTKARLTEKMALWCQNVWGENQVPEHSHLRKEVSKALDRWREVKNETLKS